MQPARETPPSVTEYAPLPLPPETRRALRVFKSHFPRLIAKHPGQWAACDESRLLGVGDSQEVLYAQCLKSGLKEEQFVVLCLLPDATEFID